MAQWLYHQSGIGRCKALFEPSHIGNNGVRTYRARSKKYLDDWKCRNLVMIEACREYSRSEIRDWWIEYREMESIMNRALYRIAIYLCIDTLTIRYISYHSFQLNYTSNGTFLLKFKVFWTLKLTNSHEICRHKQFFLFKTK